MQDLSDRGLLTPVQVPGPLTPPKLRPMPLARAWGSGANNNRQHDPTNRTSKDVRRGAGGCLQRHCAPGQSKHTTRTISLIGRTSYHSAKWWIRISCIFIYWMNQRMWRCVCAIIAMIHKLFCFFRIGNLQGLRHALHNTYTCTNAYTYRHYAAWQRSHIRHTHTITVKYRDTHPCTFIYCIYLCVCKQLLWHANTVSMLDTKVSTSCRLPRFPNPYCKSATFL